ncbi:plasmid mobilization protein [Staphylococcus hominis]|uniref:plasmid mobilization protein n=1 Tax=Staphylococcus hominis TaxID=1290 RepID=UPI001C3D8C3C|nr:hypothetical protein [Staphylococcus hominis]MBV5222559.1 hypothetical protein [Staphylococcus hominis]
MPSSFNKKAKTINVNLTQDEYDKIQKLAEIRHLNPTSYTKLVALGNRIKPTVIKSKDDTNDLHEIIEQLKNSNSTLKSERDTFKEKADLFNLFLEHVNENAFIDFDSFKHDTELRKAIMNLKKDRENL